MTDEQALATALLAGWLCGATNGGICSVLYRPNTGEYAWLNISGVVSVRHSMGLIIRPSASPTPYHARLAQLLWRQHGRTDD